MFIKLNKKVYNLSLFILLYKIVNYVGADFENSTVPPEQEPTPQTPLSLPRPIIKIHQGKLMGITLLSRNGRKFYAFCSIRYGTAKRFENPKLAKKWNGTFDAGNFSSECAQTSWIFYQITGKEDCLTLNVYSPNLTAKNPVMVFIHGGGLSIGNGNLFHADYLMDEEVVIVTINYRLTLFGFMSTPDGTISGNFGLKDQALSLKWIQKNIHRFGGDPKSVTIFGVIAGGSATSLHMLSPLSANLFHAAISHSGSALMPSSRPKDHTKMNKLLANHLSCSILPSTEFRDCLLNKTTEQLLKAMPAMPVWALGQITPWGLTIEAPNTTGAFLTEPEEKILKSGNFNQVPWMTGMMEDDRILLTAAMVLLNPTWLADFNANWSQIAPVLFSFDKISPQNKIKASEKIYEFYFGDKNISDDTRQELVDMSSDRLFNMGIKKSAMLAAKFVPVYPFIFTHKRKDINLGNLFKMTKNFGVGNQDEINYLFHNAFGVSPPFLKGSNMEIVSRNLIRLWVSFARDKKPTKLWNYVKSWQPISKLQLMGKQLLRFLRIDYQLKLEADPFTKRLEFWDDIANEFFY